MSTFRANVPQIYLDVDRAKAESMGVPLDGVWDTLNIYLGSLYVNDFTFMGRPFHVTAQADAPFRRNPENVLNLKTRNLRGEMVPLGTLVARAGHRRAGAGGPLQHVLDGGDYREHAPRHEFGRNAARHK